MPVRPTRGNDYTGMNCDDFLPVETPEDWDRYNECLRQNAMVGNNQEQKSSREAFKGGQWDPYVDQIPNPADKKIQWGDPLYTREQIEGAIPGLNLSGMPGIDSFSTPEQALAASMAGLQQLNDLEAQQKPLINPQDFAVNPYRGFFAQYGGYMSGDPQETMMTNSLLQIQDLTNNAILNTKSKKKKTDIAQAFMRVAEKLGVGIGNRNFGNFVGEKYQDGGMVEGDNIVPIQAEKGEMIIFPNGTTSPVKASKKHSQMSDDEVTDLIPQEPDGSSPYIASSTPSVKLSKKEAADYVLNINDKPYVQNGKVKEPTLVTLADYFTNNKKMTPADLVKAADKKHRIQETREGEIQDPYTQQTNSFNLRFRQEQLFPNIIQAAEDKVQKVQTEEFIDDLSFIASNADTESINPMMGMMSQQPTQLPQQFKYGGKVTGDNPGKYLPIWVIPTILAGSGILQGLFSGSQSRKLSKKQKELAEKRRKELLEISNRIYEEQKQSVGLGTMASIGAQLAALQAPERPSADPRNILAYQQLREQVPAELAAGQAMQRTATNVALANAAPILMSLPPEQRAGAMSQAVIGASSQAALAGLQQARATEREIAGKTSEMLRQDLMADYGAREKFRGERQATTLGIGQSIAQQQSTLANLSGQRGGREMGIESQYYSDLATAEQTRRQGNINAMGTAMAGVQSGAMAYQGNWNAQQGIQTPTYNALSQSPYLQPGATFQGAPAPQIGASTSYGGIGIDMNAYRNITGGAGTATGGPGINPSFFGLSSQPAFSGNAAAATQDDWQAMRFAMDPFSFYRQYGAPNFYQQFGGYINSGRESVFDKYTRLKKMEEGGYTSDPKAEKKKSKDVNYDSLIEYIKEAEGFTFQQGGFIASESTRTNLINPFINGLPNDLIPTEDGQGYFSPSQANEETMSRGFGPIYNDKGDIVDFKMASGQINPVDDPLTMALVDGTIGGLSKYAAKKLGQANFSIYDGIITPAGFKNRVSSGYPQLGSFKGIGHLSEEGYTYRTLGLGEIEAIRNTKGVFPKPGKAKGGNTNVKYWTKGNNKNWYADNPNQQVIRVKDDRLFNDKVVDAKDVEIFNHETQKFEPILTIKKGGYSVKYQDGGFIPSSPLGQWKYPGQTVNVPSNNITMKGINHPNLGIGDNGVMKMMFPGKNYNFPGAKSVTEIPILPNKFQDGGPVKNPYEQGSELSRLWERFSEGYKPTSNVSIASGMSGVFIEDGQKYNRSLDLVADMGESSGRLESSLRELQQNQIRNKYGIVESRYSDPNSPTGNVFIESPDFNIYGNISGDKKEGILYPMTKITKEGKDIYTGMFKRPPVVDSNKRFKTKQEAEDYLVNTTKRLPFDANPRNFDIVDTGKNGFLVMESAAFSQLLDRTYRERSAQELAKVASLGYDPSTEDIKYGVGQENKNIVLKLSEELGKMFTGGKRYYDVRNGKLVEVTDQPGKERIKKGKTVETRSFAGTDPLLSLTLPKSKFGGFTNFDTKKKKV